MPVHNESTLVYNVQGQVVEINPQQIVAQRAPGANDFALIGTFWIDTTTNAVYTLAAVTGGVPQWVTSPASGDGTFTSVEVTTGDLTVDLGDVIISAGDLDVVAGDTTLGGNLTVNGDTTFAGDVDITSSAAISITSTSNTAPAILLHANGGTSESIELHSDQGTSATSINIHSDDGGVTVASGKAAAAAINLTASAGGVISSSALQTLIGSSQAAADAIKFNASNAAGGVTVAAGTGGVSASTTGKVTVTSTDNAAQSIYLHANGGTSETIELYVDQGTSLSSLNLHSDVGGIALTATGLANADAIKLTSTLGGVHTVSALQTLVASSQAAADSIKLNASNAAGGVTVASGTGGLTASSSGLVTITSTDDANDCILLRENGGVSGRIQLHADQGTGDDSILLLSDVGGIQIEAAGSTSVSSLQIVSIAGGIISTSGLQNLVESAQAAADAVKLYATDVAGGVTIASGTAGLTATTTGVASITSTDNAANAIYLHANGGTSETIKIHADQGTGVASLNLLSDVGGLTLRATGLASADAINLEAAAGGIDMDSALTTSITSSQAAATAIALTASDAAGGVTITTGTGGNTLTGTGKTTIVSTNNATQAIYLHANGGTSETVQLHADQGTAVNSINILSDVGGLTLTATGLASADAINLEAPAGGIDMDAALQINITSTQDSGTAISLNASAGGIELQATGAAAQDINIVNTGGSVNITATEAISSAMVLTASNAAGGITLAAGASGGIVLSSSGNVSMAPSTATFAGAAVTINARVGSGTFTGLTTASAASQQFTITNSQVAASSVLFVTVTNVGSNDAQMTMQRVKPASGSFTVDVKNNGAAALNGDVVINFWVIA
jgi:hypothetical protein